MYSTYPFVGHVEIEVYEEVDPLCARLVRVLRVHELVEAGVVQYLQYLLTHLHLVKLGGHVKRIITKTLLQITNNQHYQIN